MSTIYLIRHGQASAGTSNYDRLSQLGRRQADLLGQWWSDIGFSADHAFAGSLERQQHTAEIALESANLPLEVNEIPQLNEYDHHSVDKLFGNGTRTDMDDGLSFEQYVEIIDRWRAAEAGSHDGLEAWHEFIQRGVQAIDQAHVRAGGRGKIVMFTSGGVIATVLSQALNLNFNATLHTIWRTRNSSVTTLEYDGERVYLTDYNTIGHLHTHADESLVTLI